MLNGKVRSISVKEAGSKGGKRRAEKLSPEERSAIAKKASDARWKKRDEENK